MRWGGAVNVNKSICLQLDNCRPLTPTFFCKHTDFTMQAVDPHTATIASAYKVAHLNIDWNVDFVRQTVSGTVELLVERREDSHGSLLILDSKHLNVERIYDADSNSPLKWHVDETINRFSSALIIDVSSGEESSNPKKTATIAVVYSTTAASTALQWLSPSQTADKMHPFLFTQCQAIHARSLLPCQDTPSVKATYAATVRVPVPMIVLMSAIASKDVFPSENNEESLFRFEQRTPIPSYLLALAVGLLERRSLSERCAVYAEPSIIDSAAYEFVDTEAFVQAAEALVGVYRWLRYDLLVLPPSFPYGGMENPCVTFVTPSLLAGDRSLVDVVAHEVAHSWSGNLVTAASSEHFWLNEGWTMYIERRIIGRLNGEPLRQFDALLGRIELTEDVAEFGAQSPLTSLVPDLSDIAPDDAFSLVPYEKGFLLLFSLEQLLGIEAFTAYARAYIDAFQGSSIDTETWLAHLKSHFSACAHSTALLSTFPFHTWFYAVGDAPVTNAIFTDTSLIDAAHSVSAAVCNFAKDDSNFDTLKTAFSHLHPKQKQYVLGLLLQEQTLSVDTLAVLHDVLVATNSLSNVEIHCKWLQIALRNRMQNFYADAAAFACAHGRMKYCRRIFRELSACDAKLATDVFLGRESFFHPIAASMIRKDLKLL